MDKTALKLPIYVRNIFLIFEEFIKSDKRNLGHCVVTAIESMEEKERNKIFKKPVDWIWIKDVSFVCPKLCHAVWGSADYKNWCPCHRFGEETALKNLTRLCKAIRRINENAR